MGNDCLGAIANLKQSPPALRSTQSYHSTILQDLVKTPPSPMCEVCVIVPVQNEAENIENSLTALSKQTDLQGLPLDYSRYEVIVLANNCSDDSAQIARNFAQLHPNLALHVVEISFPPAEAYIGRVRQILMDEAERRLSSIGKTTGVIASTDGDTQVDSTWIAATLYEIACGADAVGGRIISDRIERAALDPYTRACYLREVGYRYLVAELETYLDGDPFDVLPRHYQHFGASLAVTAQIYKQAGGMPAVRTPEDVAFYQALVRVNARFRHSPLVKVITSARQKGRTNIGLANQLHQWTKMGYQNQPFLVESPAEIETRLRARHQLRKLWQRILLNGYQPTHNDIAPLADTLGIGTQSLMQELAQPQTFGLLWERVEQHQKQEGIWVQRFASVRIEQAIADLRLRLHSLRHSRYQDEPKFAQIDQGDTVLPVDLLNAAV